MKRITILLTTLLTLAFAAGCRDEASLDGLESQTKEDGTTAGETAGSKAVKEALTYESSLEYNWVTEYAPAEGLSYTLLFNFSTDGSVISDSPVSENEKALALFTVSGLDEGGVASIKFDGATMLGDEIIDPAYRERRLIVESYDENTVSCVGAESGSPVVLRKATSEDVLQLGEKLVWTALSGANAMKAVVRDGEGHFIARYAVDRATKSIEFTWIDASSSDVRHERATVGISTSESEYTLSWDPVSINGAAYESLTYQVAGRSAALNVADVTLGQPMEANGGFVNKASKQYNLGGRSQTGAAHPVLWEVLAADDFRSILFYPYADDIPLRVEVYSEPGGSDASGNYLFVNDYTDNPKTARYDYDGDWIRFYASTRGDFLKIATGTEFSHYTLSQMGENLKAFSDFYFHADGLYIVSDQDDAGSAWYLLSATTNLWVKVRQGMIQEPDGEVPDENFLPELVAKGMPRYGTFFDNGNKYFRLHYTLNPEAGTADLIWITDTEQVYADGAYKDMAMNRAQYATVEVSASEAGVVRFKTPIEVGEVTYNGLTWTEGGKPQPMVIGLECTIRTPLTAEGHPLEYFYTYPVNKYEGGTKVFLPHTQLCLPTSSDGIVGVTGTDRYLLLPEKTLPNGYPAGPAALEIYPVDKGERIYVKSWKANAAGDGVDETGVSFPVASYKVEDDRMIFTPGEASGGFYDADGNSIPLEEARMMTAPLEKLLFGEQGFHVYKAEAVSYDDGKHYFYLVSPDPAYPYWIKVREG
ncbi:hypothetical protein [uncultured Alistipes sp.]|uniref:hypothetical protein n=1 Tax=uncultured Alistipes sp. TaxID=538949 RepID=UPI0026228AB5|nr:hypothetical protein [uncultured Alistipes sp.]